MKALLGTTSPRRRRIPARIVLVAVILLAGGLAIRVVASLIDGPSSIGAVHVENQTDFGVDVDVRGSPDGGLTRLGLALPNTTTTRHHVIDQGATWIFTFRRSGVIVEEVSISRAQLVRDGWRIIVPAVVEERLLDQGAEPFPNQGRN